MSQEEDKKILARLRKRARQRYRRFQTRGNADKAHAPRYKRDCARCKFSWCCGELCACHISGKPPTPKTRREEVEMLQETWRRTKGY